MNIGEIKKEFPIFDNKVHNHDLVYLDSANSSQKPRVVVDRIYDFYTKEFSNIGRSVHYLAVAATNLYENTRSSVQKYINAKDKNEIVFTKGATEALNLVANTLGQKYLNEGDEIILTELEHHSNYVPWHYLRKKRGAIIKFASVNENGEIDVDEFKKQITKNNPIMDHFFKGKIGNNELLSFGYCSLINHSKEKQNVTWEIGEKDEYIIIKAIKDIKVEYKKAS